MFRVRGQLLAFALVLGLFVAASAAALASFVWPSADRWIQVGLLDDFPPGSVTPVHSNLDPLVFHVVRLGDGELLVLSARNIFYSPGCVVSYRPDHILDDRAGWFHDTCYPFAFDMEGYPANGTFTPPSRLDRVEVEVRNGNVYVDPRAITRGRGQAMPDDYEFQAGGALLPERSYSLRY